MGPDKAKVLYDSFYWPTLSRVPRLQCIKRREEEREQRTDQEEEEEEVE